MTEVGHDKLRDVDTTHYHATIDLTKALDRVSADVAQRLGIDPDQLGKSFEQLRTQAGSDELPMDVWVDANGRLRRMRMEMGAASGGVHIDMEMYDYGVDVSVQAPPADEVTDLFDAPAASSSTAPAKRRARRPDPRQPYGRSVSPPMTAS